MAINETAVNPDAVNQNNEEPTTPICPHYWVIQPAEGPVSQGICQICGQTKEFKNYVEASTWGDDRSAGRTRGDNPAAVAKSVASYRTDEDYEE